MYADVCPSPAFPVKGAPSERLGQCFAGTDASEVVFAVSYRALCPAAPLLGLLRWIDEWVRGTS